MGRPGRPGRNTGFNGAQLRRARREKRLSQTELGEILGVHRSTVVRWEVGMAEPGPEQIEEIAVALSTPKAWFIEEAAEAISLDEPIWLMDPLLKSYPLEEIQENTSAALLALGKPAKEIVRATRLTRARVEDLMVGKKPTAREIQRLRDTYGADFDPTPEAIRQPRERKNAHTVAIPLALPVGAPAGYLSSDEKLDVVMQRLSRLEQRLVSVESHLTTMLPLLEALAEAPEPAVRVKRKVASPS